MGAHRQHPTTIEMLSHHGLHRFNETHMAQIVADADADAAAVDEPTTAGEDAAEKAMEQWPPAEKVRLMRDAALHWLPPTGDEMSHWWTSNASARAFLDRYPDIRDLLALDWDQESSSPRDRTQRALELMAEMADHAHNSPGWQQRLEKVRAGLVKIARAPAQSVLT